MFSYLTSKLQLLGDIEVGFLGTTTKNYPFYCREHSNYSFDLLEGL